MSVQTDKDVEVQQDQGEQNNEPNIAAEPAPKRAFYSSTRSTKRLRTSQQEKARSKQTKYDQQIKKKANPNLFHSKSTTLSK